MIEQHASLAEKFLKKGFWLYLFSFIIAPIWYIIKIIISGELSVSEIGILYWIISLITMISAYNDLWMTESLKHFVPEYVTKKRYDKVKSILFYALFTQITTALIIAGIFYFWADYIAINYFKSIEAVETLKVFAFFFIGLNIFQTINQFFLSVQDTFSQKISEMFRMWFIMFSVLFIFFWDASSLLHYSYSWLIWLYIGILIVLYLFYTKYYSKYFKTTKIIIDKKLIKKTFKYASLVFIWASAATILGQMDMQMIIYLLGTTEAGYYTNYLSIIWIPFIIIGPIFAFLFPVFSELHSKKQHDKIKLIKELFVRNFLLIWIMFNLFFFVFAEIIAFTLFWEKFIESWIILKYSILLLIFNFLLQINFNILSWIWQVSSRVKIVYIAVVFNFIMNIILINTIWVYGAALATSMWWLLIYLLSEYFLWKKYRVQYWIHSILKNLWILWIIWILIHIYFLEYINSFSRLESLWTLFITFVIWFCIFVVINYSSVKNFIWEIKKLKK